MQIRGAVAGAILLAGTVAAGPLGIRVAYVQRKLAALRPSHYKHVGAPPHWADADDVGCRLLIVGDSRVAMWPTRSESGMAVEKFGAPGATASGFASKAAEAIRTIQPDVVIIQLGINDATAAALQTPTERKQTMRQALLALQGLTLVTRDANSIPILMTVPNAIRPPLWQRIWFDPARATLVRDLNEQIRHMSRARSALLLDANSILSGSDGRLSTAYDGGGLHWNGLAYSRLNSALLAILQHSSAGLPQICWRNH